MAHRWGQDPADPPSPAAREVRPPPRTRSSADDRYLEGRSIYYGTATGDEALTGDVELHIRGLASDDTRTSFNEGTFRIRRAGAGWVSQGRFADAASGGEFKGFIIGETRVPPHGVGTRGRLFGVFEVGFEPGRGVLVRIGGPATDPELPAVQATGRCTGEWETFAVDFTGSGAARAAAAGPRGVWGR